MKRSWLSHLFIPAATSLLATGLAGAATLVPITVCTDCHGTNPQTNQAPIEGTERNIPGRAIVGTHASHNSSLTCAGCHGTLPTATNHTDGKITLISPIAGGAYTNITNHRQQYPYCGTCT